MCEPGCRPAKRLLAPNVGALVVPVAPANEIVPCDTPSMKSSAEPPFGLVAYEYVTAPN